MMNIYIRVAQGICPGPLICTIYLNCSIKCSIEINFLIFSEDTPVYVFDTDISQDMSIINQCLSRMYHCLFMIKLSINDSYPNFVIFHLSQQIN